MYFAQERICELLRNRTLQALVLLAGFLAASCDRPGQVEDMARAIDLAGMRPVAEVDERFQSEN